MEGDRIYINYDFENEEWWLYPENIYKTKKEAYQNLMEDKADLFDILFKANKHWKILSKQ